MSNFITEYRPFVEFLYLLSGPLTLIGLIIAVSQLKTIRGEAQIRFTRESTFQTLNLIDKKLLSITNLKYSLDISEPREFSGEIPYLYKNAISGDSEWLESISQNIEIQSHAINLLNEMEIFSQYVLSKVIDESLCFSLQGEHVYNIIKSLEPYIAFFRETENDSTFSSIIKLSNLWENKLKFQKLKLEEHKIAHQLNKIIIPKEKKPLEL